jgi:hypothetical protein
MTGTVKLVRSCVFLLTLNLNQYPPTPIESKRIQEFRALNGQDQVHMLLHGTSIFRKAFTTDFQNEEEILVASTDPSVNGSLATEVARGGTETAREAVFMLCQRARFVRSPEFPLKVPLDGFVAGIQGGLISPFAGDFDRMGTEASQVVREALNSSNVKLRTTAKIYCGGLEQELASMPADELVARWRAELGKLPSPIFADSDFSETGELVRVLKRALAERGLESATAMSLLLDKEIKSWARENEIEMIEFLDGAAVRLRGSQQGRDVIQIVKRTIANKQLKFYKNKEEQQGEWEMLQYSFFKDEYTSGGTARDHWVGLIGLAFEQYYGDQVLIARGHRRPSFTRANEFMTCLTSVDPNFPSWEFASTLSEEDMFHPRFKAKIARYYAIWVQMNASQCPTR